MQYQLKLFNIIIKAELGMCRILVDFLGTNMDTDFVRDMSHGHGHRQVPLAQIRQVYRVSSTYNKYITCLQSVSPIIKLSKGHLHGVEDSVSPVPDTASLTSEDECKWY